MITNIEGPVFRWWTGVVEDIVDPLETGRVKVRIYGYHSADLNELPVKDLPFATPIMPVSNAGVNGIMENHSLVCGSLVVGFFADGEEGQIPMGVKVHGEKGIISVDNLVLKNNFVILQRSSA